MREVLLGRADPIQLVTFLSMCKLSLPAIAAFLFLVLSGCSKGGDDTGTLVPHARTPKLIINGPTAVIVQKYQDTVIVPFEFRSDSARQIDVKNIIFTGTDNDLGMS